MAFLRRMAAALRPVMLDDRGLVPAICSQQGATASFRIVQEVLNNVARHA